MTKRIHVTISDKNFESLENELKNANETIAQLLGNDTNIAKITQSKLIDKILSEHFEKGAR